MTAETDDVDVSTDATRFTLTTFFSFAWRGFCMGSADVVPGVSGGTVALIVGIYERLVKAISHFDVRLMKHLFAGRFRKAAEHVDLPFLFSLGCGVVAGLGVAIMVVNKLLSSEVTRSYTYAAFFGMILASGFLVARLVKAKTTTKGVAYFVAGVVAAGFAFWVATLPKMHQEPSPLYVFVCGSVAICAMILPGISGAMILLMLGVYEHLTEIPRLLLKGEHIAESLQTIAIFGLGCAISLVCCSKFLRWLLKHHHSLTMAILCGLLFGGLAKLWPFVNDLTPKIEKFKHKEFAPRMPESFTEFATVTGVMILAALLVVGVEYFAGNRQSDETSGTY